MPISSTLNNALATLNSYAAGFTNMSSASALDAEQAAFDADVKALKQWWSEPRWRHTRRPFTAEQIVSKRGSIQQGYANGEMATKLFNIVEKTFADKTADITYGCLDPVMVTQMAKYLNTVYVSGWQCSSTASSTNEPGPDLADYPYVRLLYFFESRLLCRHWLTRSRLLFQKRSTTFGKPNCSTTAARKKSV